MGVVCVRNRNEGNPLPAGWLSQGLAATFGTGPCIYDATRRTWLWFGPRTAARYVTDGSGLAGSVTPGTLTVIASDQRATTLTLPSWGADWTTSGGALSPITGGGYLIDLAPVLAQVSRTGVLTEQPIPGGFLVVAPTSKANTFVLRTDLRKSPEAMNGSYQAFLWTVGDARPARLLDSVVRVTAVQAPDLAWLADDSQSWWRVNATGVAAKEIPAVPGRVFEPDPTGRYVVDETDRSLGCEQDASCASRLIERAGGNVLAFAAVGSNTRFVWSEGRVAFAPTTSDPVNQPSATEMVVFAPDGTLVITLPST